jgi:cytochrome c-type biogenesis protein CcmH/NrfG
MLRTVNLRKAWPMLLGGALIAAALAWTVPSVWAGLQPDQTAEEEIDLEQALALLLEGTAAKGHRAASYAELERHLKRKPKDGRALVFKARMDMQAERFELAAAGFDTALKVAPKVARDPSVWVEFAEARAMAQGGTLVGEPQRLLEKALALDAHHAPALDLAGSAAWERRDFAQAAYHWKRLLDQTPEGSTRHADVTAAVARAEVRAKVSLPPSL